MAALFLSYSRDDTDQISVLANDIRSLGHDPWLDRELTGGQRWWDHILEEIRGCDAFVVAVSASSMDSRACVAEYEYAVTLGKPVLPVMVRAGVADRLMPPHLAQLHRVDYTTGDKAAFAALNRAVGSLPASSALPDPLPPAPAVPASYLYDLKTEIEASGAMAPDVQAQLVAELRSRLDSGHAHADIAALVQRFRQRDDLLVRTDQDLTALEGTLHGQPAASTAPPVQPTWGDGSQPPVTEEPTPMPTPVSSGIPVVPSTPGSEVNALWWIAPILGGLIGGVVAFFAVRQTSPDTAKNLLIAGAVMSVVWTVFFSV